MIIDILTLFPGIFRNVFDESILGSAIKNGLIKIRVHNFRQFGEGRHKVVDDSPFGGGPGMLLKPGPVVDCLRELRKDPPTSVTVGLTPQGSPLTQNLVKELAGLERIILVCGRYEGFDERIIPQFDLQISIGDYVLSGGEFPAMVLVDSISRMIPGTVGRRESVEQDSFFTGGLDHPQYTRPKNWEGKPVPTTLMEGNHAKIEQWRRAKSLIKTAVKRPDLFGSLPISQIDKTLIQKDLFSIKQ